MSTMSYNPHSSSYPCSDWLLHNSAVDMQAHQQQQQQLFFWEPSFVVDLDSSASPPSDKISRLATIPTSQYTAFWDYGRFYHKQQSISPLILRSSERDCFENKSMGYSYSDGLTSMSTVTEEKCVLDGLYQGFDEEEGIVPSKAFDELTIPLYFEDGMEDIPFLVTAQASCSPSDHSDAVGSSSSVSLHSPLDQFSSEFRECPSELQAILGPPEPPVAHEDLVEILIKCAEASSEGQHDILHSHLAKLQELSSPFGDPLQRISFYASEALKKNSFKQGRIEEKTDEKSCLEHDLAHQALYQLLPYHKFLHFTSNQAILEAIGGASHVHIIDLKIRQGLQWPSFIQSLSLRPGGPPKLLKITAIGNHEQRLKQTGRRLHEFAQSVGIELTFRPLIAEMEELEESAFNIEAHETVAVNCSVVLNKMLCKSGKIHGLLALLRRLNPVILTVMEIESNQNMPSLVARFLQCLIFLRAVFHSIEASMERNNPERILIERVCIAPNIASVLVDDKENSLRYACIDSWRKFLRHSGFKDSPLSHYSQCQANLLLGLYSNDSFKLHQDGFTITLAWQDTPIVSVSAWKL
ncbi:hypothetical protein SUGI_1205570 [Cryptomeria japonica]|uniref:GRAS family protein RAM1 n=1 Tax=Cryptomeria japonica TaxID=3369 RepID=UPI0024149BFB|nr:GRAS family protein RAM1 [Cryptomeria japonica]GLJ56159.1 hypothetical protein SUGI_1205570 [Cryptomeria japonica]